MTATSSPAGGRATPPTSRSRGWRTGPCCAAPTPTRGSAGIDAGEARALPGVIAVITGEDAAGAVRPDPPQPRRRGARRQPRGDPLPGARARALRGRGGGGGRRGRTPGTAAHACRPGRDRLRAAAGGRSRTLDALAAGAPLLHEEWGSNVIVAGHVGDREFDALAAGCTRVAGEVRAHRGTAAPLEPRAWLVDYDPAQRRLTMYATTQNPHPLRTTLAAALRLDERRVRLVAPR